MPGTCVIGLQWGDEAKGKLVDLLADRKNVEIVVRYQGGANAGHTVVIGDDTYKLHHIPSGILTDGVMNVIAPGVVMHPGTILEEIDGLVQRGIDVPGQLLISDRVHLVFPWHIAEDRAVNAGEVIGESIGTTLRGIGPCYRDKYGRMTAIRMGDLYSGNLAERIEQVVQWKRKTLAGFSEFVEESELDAEAIFAEYQDYAKRLEPMVGDTTEYLLNATDSGRNLLFEGAQGSLLDIDHGTFPFVTSSNSSGVGISGGSGVPAKWIGRVYGVAKAYTTRVGGGPFPTELHDEVGKTIRNLGNEYGTTTGRPRRCGWFDGVAVRYTVRLGGIHGLAVMMMDVISQLPEIKICVAYEIDGERTGCFPSQVDDLRRVQPIYETLPGWEQDVSGVRTMEELPDGARRFLDRVSEIVGCPVAIVSVGPDRAQTIIADDLLR